MDVFWVFLFTGDGSKMDKGGSQELRKVEEAETQSKESERFWPPPLT